MAGGVNFICIVTVWCLLQYTGCATGLKQNFAWNSDDFNWVLVFNVVIVIEHFQILISQFTDFLLVSYLWRGGGVWGYRHNCYMSVILLPLCFPDFFSLRFGQINFKLCIASNLYSKRLSSLTCDQHLFT